jgi:hypothetical protein
MAWTEKTNSDPNTILTARRLLFAKSNVMSFCIESAFMLRKAIPPIAPKSAAQKNNNQEEVGCGQPQQWQS